jgi:hypothetical protein
MVFNEPSKDEVLCNLNEILIYETFLTNLYDREKSKRQEENIKKVSILSSGGIKRRLIF